MGPDFEPRITLIVSAHNHGLRSAADVQATAHWLAPEAKPINEILNKNLNAWLTARPGLDLDWP